MSGPLTTAVKIREAAQLIREGARAEGFGGESPGHHAKVHPAFGLKLAAWLDEAAESWRIGTHRALEPVEVADFIFTEWSTTPGERLWLSANAFPAHLPHPPFSALPQDERDAWECRASGA